MDWEDVWSIARVILVVLLLCALLLAGVMGLVNLSGTKGCNNYAAMNPTYEFKYDFWAGGCFVKLDGFYILTDHIQFINGHIQSMSTP